VALRLNELGFRVYATVLDTKNSGSVELCHKCSNKDKMCVLAMDVTKDEEIDHCFHTIVSDLKTTGDLLWAVVNNAGRLTCGPTSWGSFDDYKKEFDVNVFGVVRVTRKFTPLVIGSKGKV